ncbi:EcsC family protein [Haloimpatiens massiliensis]|uniref:EcsC family protein n=1 Tax=Haloimpatiens massiliensis TaxID=1658110 RepID=UPI000C845B8E|nr:EcsC family protein [Haloimpatiens massiliensis]
MEIYTTEAIKNLKLWDKKMSKKPFIKLDIAKGLQDKMNSFIPEKAHEIITIAIKNMVKGVLIGSEFSTKNPLINATLKEREEKVLNKLEFYKKTAALSGAGTGAGGILIGLTDFPILLSIKIKFLFDTASLYGFDVKNYKERLYILYIFQLAFSSKERRLEIYKYVRNWNTYVKSLPENINDFDWRKFQQEYRDYIDLAKMLQLVPGIGAIVGAVANYKLMNKLGETSMNAYRLRLFKDTLG